MDRKLDFDSVWSRIERHAGDAFTLLRGREFSYSVSHGYLKPSTVNQNIPRSQFERACERLPISNTVAIQDLRGPSYLYAILMDERIRNGEW